MPNSQPSTGATPKRIVIMGTPVRSGNRGVLALGASLANLCAESSPGASISLLLSNRAHETVPFRIAGQVRPVRVIPIRWSPRARPTDHFLWIITAACLYRCLPLAVVRRALARLTPWIQAIAEADLVGDVRGGDSFSDIYGLKGFLEGCLAAGTVVLVRGRGVLVHFPQTFGPYSRRTAQIAAALLLRRSGTIIARDVESRAVAQQIVGPAKTVRLSPDVAFSLEPVRPAKVVVTPGAAGPVPRGVIGLNVNGLMYHGGYTRQNMFGLTLDYAAALVPLVTALLNAHPGELWLVPHTYAPAGHVESDPDACQRVRDALPAALAARVRIVTGEYDQHEIKGIIGQFEFFVGSRMHACIAALSQGVPCVGIAYSRKFAGVFASVGMKDWVVDGRTCANADAIARVVSLYHERRDVAAGLAQRAAAARAELAAVFGELLGSSDRPVTSPAGTNARPEAVAASTL